MEFEERRAFWNNWNNKIWYFEHKRGAQHYASSHLIFTEPLGGENFYPLLMYEACILDLLQQVGRSPQLLGSWLRTEVRTLGYSKDPLPSLPLPQSNLLSFGSPRLSPKLFLQIQVPCAQIWGPSGSVCSAAGASVISVFSWSHFQYLYHQRAPAVAYHQHGPCSQNQSVYNLPCAIFMVLFHLFPETPKYISLAKSENSFQSSSPYMHIRNLNPEPESCEI